MIGRRLLVLFVGFLSAWWSWASDHLWTLVVGIAIGLALVWSFRSPRQY